MENVKNRIEDSMRIGSLKADYYFSMYEKGKLIRGKDKEYIEDFWRENHLFNSESDWVNRFELRLSDKALQKISIEISSLEKPEYLWAILKHFGEKRLRFIEPSKLKNVSRKRKIDLIDWTQIPNTVVLPPLQKEKTFINKRSCKTTIRHLYSIFLITHSKEALTVIDEICELFPALQGWYKMQKGKWQVDYNNINNKMEQSNLLVAPVSNS